MSSAAGLPLAPPMPRAAAGPRPIACITAIAAAARVPRMAGGDRLRSPPLLRRACGGGLSEGEDMVVVRDGRAGAGATGGGAAGDEAQAHGGCTDAGIVCRPGDW